MKSYTPWSDGALAPFARSRRRGGHESLIDAVMDITCRFAECSREQLVGQRRTRAMVESRTAAYIAIRVLSVEGVSLPALGRAFDRDHTTVMHAIQRTSLLAEQMAEDVIEAYEVEAMERPKLWVVGE